MSRDRIEDLGRVMVLIENLLDHKLFGEERTVPGDMAKWFRSLSDDCQDQWVESVGEGIEGVEYALERILEVCKGKDYLNGK